MGKSRVVLLKPMTIPRMELTAVVMAACMDKMLRSELQPHLEESVFWSDSMTVLKYIGNRTSRFRSFVANRVEIILKMSKASQWRYVSPTMNPEDDVSRGLTAKSFFSKEVWIQGPDFLWRSEEEWPESRDNPVVRNAIVSATVAEHQSDTVQQLMERISFWMRLRKTVAWILKLKSMLLCRQACCCAYVGRGKSGV